MHLVRSILAFCGRVFSWQSHATQNSQEGQTKWTLLPDEMAVDLFCGMSGPLSLKKDSSARGPRGHVGPRKLEQAERAVEPYQTVTKPIEIETNRAARAAEPLDRARLERNSSGAGRDHWGLIAPVSCKRYSFQKENQVRTAPTRSNRLDFQVAWRPGPYGFPLGGPAGDG